MDVAQKVNEIEDMSSILPDSNTTSGQVKQTGKELFWILTPELEA